MNNEHNNLITLICQCCAYLGDPGYSQFADQFLRANKEVLEVSSSHKIWPSFHFHHLSQFEDCLPKKSIKFHTKQRLYNLNLKRNWNNKTT